MSAMRGVLAILAAADFAAMGGDPAGWLIQSRGGETMRDPKRAVQALGKLIHVDAVVVAEGQNQIRDADEVVATVITQLPAIVNKDTPIADPSNRVQDENENTVCFHKGWIEANRAAVNAVFGTAPHVITLDLVNIRLVINETEPHASIGDFHSGIGNYKQHTSGQKLHQSRLLTAGFITGIVQNKLTVTPTFLHGTLLNKPDQTPLIYVNVKTVFTNTAPVGTDRDAGRPEAALAGRIGGPAVRSRGTIGGSLTNTDPSACYPAAVVGAVVETGRRTNAAVKLSPACNFPFHIARP